MKKAVILFVFALLLTGNNTILAEELNEAPSVIEASVQFDWINMEQIKRDEKIDSIKTILFGPEGTTNIKRKEFRTTYKDFLKDTNVKTHYRLISNGATETKDNNLAGFFRKFKGEDILYSYAIQPKNDLRHAYYYSALGHLAYVDDVCANYPNFPYYSKQYRANGQLAGAIYFETKDMQYVYNPNGKFKGVWYKDKMYDRKGNEILTRTNW